VFLTTILQFSLLDSVTDWINVISVLSSPYHQHTHDHFVFSPDTQQNTITTSLFQLSNQNSLHMHSCYSYSYSYGSTYIPFKLNRLTPRTGPVRAALSSPEKRTRKKKQVKDDDTLLENSLRFSFMEELMNRARNRDSTGVSQVMYDMIAAGLSPGPRSFHGLVVSYALNGDEQAAVMFKFTCFQLTCETLWMNLEKHLMTFS
jgi:hypothetical protein